MLNPYGVTGTDAAAGTDAARFSRLIPDAPMSMPASLQRL